MPIFQPLPVGAHTVHPYKKKKPVQRSTGF